MVEVLNGKKVMVLGGGIIQVPLIKKCINLGLKTYVVDKDENAPGFEYVDEKIILSTHDSNTIFEKAKNIGIHGIVTTSDYPVNVVSFVAEKLGLCSLRRESAMLCTNKYLLRSRLIGAKLYCPRFKLINSRSDLLDVDFFPLVVKPVDSSASRGVYKVNNLSELLDRFERSMNYSKRKQLIVEEYVSGKEFSVETITQNGVTEVAAITEKLIHRNEKGFFVEHAHIVPAEINPEERQTIESAVKEALNMINLDNSAAHTELIVSDENVFIVEIGARLGGDFIGSHLVPIATGIDMLESVIRIALNEKVRINRTKQMYSAIQFITPSNYKKAKEYIDSDFVLDSEIFDYNDIDIENSLDRLGHIIFAGSSRKIITSIINEINDTDK